jgi:DNA polymerase-3 subunit alpha
MSDSSNSFVHLHVHTEYSILDGAAKVKALIEAAKADGQPAIAMTDHGNVHAAYEFYQTATKAGIKPIIGMEAYVAPRVHRSDKTRTYFGDLGKQDVSYGAYTHMTLLATSTEGMYNLFKLSSLAYMEGMFYKPRIDRELLRQYGKGLVGTTGCLSGEVQTLLKFGRFDDAVETVKEMQQIFGKENYYCELMRHGIPDEEAVEPELLRLAKATGMPLLATNDLHYVHEHDAEYQEALLCVQSNATLNDPGRFKFDGSGFYLKSAAQMRELFKDLPEAIDNTITLAERCHVEFPTRELIPNFPVPEGETEDSWFAKEVAAGMKRRFPNGIPEPQAKQAEYEIELIQKMKFPGYFLVVADFISWARKQGIRVGPGRGSAAGAIVAYALGITDLDPIKYGLIFERFLNPDRISMPDIDVDFDDRRRGEVIQYVYQKYGEDRVSQIGTFNTIKAKAALKDAARVLGYPYSLGERLTKAFPPPVLGQEISLSVLEDKTDKRYAEASDLRAIIENEPEAQRVFELAKGLESLKRSTSVHAAGVIISKEPLIDVIPLMTRDGEAGVITQFDQPPLEKLGLLKMDFLGLRNLTVLEDALDNITRNGQTAPVLEALDLDADQKTYKLLGSGETLGVFQLDGGPMRALLKQMKPTGFEDISAAIALYRPGPMGVDAHTNYAKRKNKLQANEPIHPTLQAPLAEILDPTYGLIVYQEQVMAAAQKVANFTLGQADILRKAMGKKDADELAKLRASFASGMHENGFTEEAVTALWDTLLPFAGYAFNKAHSACYGVISYWTAYMKANHPAEYMGALLTSVGDSKDKMAIYLSECRRMGLKVLSPDVNESVARFTGRGDTIRFGMAAIKGVGEAVVEAIVAARKAQGNFKSFNDFLKKVPASVCTKRTIESLIKAGAFDSLGHTRRALLQIFETAVDAQQGIKKNEASGQTDLFGDLFDDDPTVIEVPDLEEMNRKAKLSYEREMLGLYVSDHPLTGREGQLASASDFSIGTFLTKEKTELKDGEVVTVAGLVTSVVSRVSKKSGNPYSLVSIEDFDGALQISLTGKNHTDYPLQPDMVVSVRGRVSERDDGRTINVYSITQLEGSSEHESPVLRLRLAEREATRGVLEQLNRILASHPGTSEVTVYLTGQGKSKPFALASKVRATNELFAELKGLLGMNCVMTSEALASESAQVGTQTDEVPVVVEQSTLLGTDESA